MWVIRTRISLRRTSTRHPPLTLSLPICSSTVARPGRTAPAVL
jgi:hypothetical protein